MNVNDVAKVTAQFIVSGVLTNPTAVTMTVTPPGEASYVVTYPHADLTRPSTGVYVGKVAVAGKKGRWRVEMVGTGTAPGGASSTFYAYD